MIEVMEWCEHTMYQRPPNKISNGPGIGATRRAGVKVANDNVLAASRSCPFAELIIDRRKVAQACEAEVRQAVSRLIGLDQSPNRFHLAGLWPGE